MVKQKFVDDHFHVAKIDLFQGKDNQLVYLNIHLGDKGKEFFKS